jgi:hypothetical protein
VAKAIGPRKNGCSCRAAACANAAGSGLLSDQFAQLPHHNQLPVEVNRPSFEDNLYLLCRKEAETADSISRPSGYTFQKRLTTLEPA